MLTLNEVSNRSSTIAEAVRTVASLDYHALSEVSNSTLEPSLLELEVQSEATETFSSDMSIDYALNPELFNSPVYDVSKEYGVTVSSSPVNLTELYDDEHTTSEVTTLTLTPAELEVAVKNINWAEALGDRSQVDYKTRERVAFSSLIDPVSTRLYHALNRITDNIDYGRVY
ncbi:MAG: hypothetical protein WCV90_07605 [Candidatus Woesearchaeota archaeon]|jgi:hypothetical protein